MLGIVVALFHDVGYLRTTGDTEVPNGAEFTTIHVSRGAAFLRDYLPKIDLGSWAEAAAEIIRHYYQRDVKVQLKADQSPVTEADVKSEEAIRAILSERFPSYGFYGEETGRARGDGEHLWLVDPIDGTKSFVRDCPFFSTQIALLRGSELVLGVSSAPARKPAKVRKIRTFQPTAVTSSQPPARPSHSCSALNCF